MARTSGKLLLTSVKTENPSTVTVENHDHEPETGTQDRPLLKKTGKQSTNPKPKPAKTAQRPEPVPKPKPMRLKGCGKGARMTKSGMIVVPYSAAKTPPICKICKKVWVRREGVYKHYMKVHGKSDAEAREITGFKVPIQRMWICDSDLM